MKKKWVTFILLVSFLWVGGACTGMPVRMIPLESESRGTVFFQDDFSDNKSDWETWKDVNGTLAQYSNGGLRLVVNEIQFDLWSRPGQKLTDSSLEVDTFKNAGPDDNDFGLLCRFNDRNNYYSFLISSDGYFGIVKVKDNKAQLLNGDLMQPDTAVIKGKAGNHLRADCRGSRLTFYVNGKKLAEVVDDDLSSGEVGVIAGTFNSPGADIQFDNFMVYTRP